MNDRNIQLSICIATFNRSEMLQKTLSTLVRQISLIEAGNVEIIVGDNCSSDGTEQIGRWYSNEYPYINYLRHDTNIGAERNYFTIIQHAVGDFIWLLSDDDYFLDSAINKILQVISQQQEISFIFVNYRLWSDSLQALSGPSRCIATNDCITSSADDFYLLVRYANSFIASCIYKRTKWINAVPAQYLGNHWAQLYITNEIVQREKSFIIADPLLMMRCLSPLASRMEKKNQGNDHYYMDAHIMFIRFVDELNSQLVSPAAKKLGYDLVLRSNLFQIVIYKCMAEKYKIKYLTSVFYNLFSVACFRSSILFWLKDVPVLFLPKVISVWIYEWWQIKTEICTWEKANDKHKRMIYSLYNIIRISKRWLINIFTSYPCRW